MTFTDHIKSGRVVIVGGGIAALETVLALHQLGEAQLDVTLIAPEPAFTLRPMTVAVPFAPEGHIDQLPLDAFMAEHGGAFRRDAMRRVDAERKVVESVTGTEIAYDSLVLVPGASARPAFTHAFTFASDPMALTGILADLAQGWSRSAAFVVPHGCTWPLPLYELALMTADRVWGMNKDGVDLHLVTPELSPLGIFGPEASDEISSLLAAAGITPHLGVNATVPKPGCVGLGGDRPPLHVDRIVALPVLDGPRVDGIPSDAHGFIPVDDFGRVTGVSDVYAAGDATNQPIKQGGLACQQADAVAAHIVAAAGADIEPEPAHLVLRGRLLTGSQDRFLRREAGDTSGTAASEPLWWPPAKVSSRYLAPYLAARDLVTLPPDDDHSEGIDVCVPVAWHDHYREDVLGLNTLG